MSFLSEQAEQQQSQFAEIYKLEVQSGVVYYYTSHLQDVDFEGVTYRAVPIRRSGFKRIQDVGDLSLTVEAPVTNPFIHYIANSPILPVKLTITKFYLDNPTSKHTLFFGDIITVDVQERIASAFCALDRFRMNTKIPRVVYQSFCNHIVFDTGCALIFANYATSTSVSVTGTPVTSCHSSAIGGFDDNYFTGGTIEFGGDIRMITEHKGVYITFHAPFDSSLVSGSFVQLLPGCPGDPSICINRFNNLTNFLGMPYIPTQNPVVQPLRV